MEGKHKYHEPLLLVVARTSKRSYLVGRAHVNQVFPDLFPVYATQERTSASYSKLAFFQSDANVSTGFPLSLRKRYLPCLRATLTKGVSEGRRSSVGELWLYDVEPSDAWVFEKVC